MAPDAGVDDRFTIDELPQITITSHVRYNGWNRTLNSYNIEKNNAYRLFKSFVSEV